MNIGFPIDWLITGQMISGIGTLVGAGAVAFVGWFGASQWRKQKIQANQIEVATRALRLVYEVEDDLDHVMKNMTRSDEIQKIQGLGYDGPALRIPLNALDDRYFFSIILDRYAAAQQRILSLRSERVEVRLILGASARNRLHELYEFALEVNSAATLGLERADADDDAACYRDMFFDGDHAVRLTTRLPNIVAEIEHEFSQHTSAGS